MGRDKAGSTVDGSVAVGSETVAMRDVYSQLRRLILDADLAPGSEISQIALSRQLNCSRTPLREALRLLEQEGLVVSEGAYRLIRVSSLTMSDLDDLYALRVMGEGLAIWLTVPTLRSADFEMLERDLEAANHGDLDAHRDFHRRLRGGGGGRLGAQLGVLFEHAERYQRVYRDQVPDIPSKYKESEHQAILDACRAGDRDRARTLLVDHIADTAMQLMTANRHAPYALPEAIAMATGSLEQ